MKEPSGKLLLGLRAVVAGSEKMPSLLMIALFAAASLILIGYKFAVWDQLLYLSCVDRFFLPIVNNPNDLYISTFLWRTYTTFWFLFFPLKQSFGWEWPLFIMHLVAQFFIWWGVWSLTLALTKDRLTAWLVLLLMVANKAIVGGGVQLYMADTITRFVVIPFMLFGMTKLWERKYFCSALLFGIGFQIHAMTAVYWLLAAAIGFVFCLVLNCKKISGFAPVDRKKEFRRFAWACLVFLVLALPMLLWVAATPSRPAGDFRTADFIEFVHSRESYVFLASYDATAWRTLLICILLIVLAVRHLPEDGASRWFIPWTMAIIAVLFLHFLAADVFLFQPVYKLQMIRIFDLLGLLGMIGAARILAVHARGAWQQRWLATFVAALLISGVVAPGWTGEFFALAFLFLILLELEPTPGRYSFPASLVFTAFILIQLVHPPDYGTVHSLRTLMWPGLRVAILGSAFALVAIWFNGLRAGNSFVRNATFSVSLAGLLALVFLERDTVTELKMRDGVDVEADLTSWEKVVKHTKDKITWPGEGMQDNWIQFQLWVKDNTPPGSIFFVPPTLNGFRVFSQRNAFFESYDSEPGIFQPAYAAGIIERMKAFKYWPPNERNSEYADRSYHSFKAEDWQDFSQQFDVPYLITSRNVRLPFAKLHEQGGLTLWKIDPPAPKPVAEP